MNEHHKHHVLTREEIEKLKYEMYLADRVSEEDEGRDEADEEIEREEVASNTMVRSHSEQQGAESDRIKTEKG